MSEEEFKMHRDTFTEHLEVMSSNPTVFTSKEYEELVSMSQGVHLHDDEIVNLDKCRNEIRMRKSKLSRFFR